MKLLYFVFTLFIFFWSCHRKDLSSQFTYLNTQLKIPTWDSLNIDISKLQPVKQIHYNQLFDSKGSMDQQFYYYSEFTHSNFFYTLIILTVYSDKYTSFDLVSFDSSDKLLNSVSIYIKGGDGEYFFRKQSTFKDSIFYSKYEDGHYSFSCPLDTLNYYLNSKTKIFIDTKGNIHEDTLEIKRNFVMIEKNENCEG